MTAHYIIKGDVSGGMIVERGITLTAATPVTTHPVPSTRRLISRFWLYKARIRKNWITKPKGVRSQELTGEYPLYLLQELE